MFHRKPQRMERHHVKITIDPEADLIKRAAILMTAMTKTLTGTRLIRVLEADYEAGCIVMVIEADTVNPNIAPAFVHIEVKKWL